MLVGHAYAEGPLGAAHGRLVIVSKSFRLYRPIRSKYLHKTLQPIGFGLVELRQSRGYLRRLAIQETPAKLLGLELLVYLVFALDALRCRHGFQTVMECRQVPLGSQSLGQQIRFAPRKQSKFKSEEWIRVEQRKIRKAIPTF